MTELILSHIVDNIIDDLGSAAVKEIGSHCGVSIELRLLESNFSLIKDVLPDAEKRKVHESGIRSWLESLEEAVYEADDLVDDFNAEARRRKEMPGNYEMAKQLAFRFKMGNSSKEIRKKLDQIVDNCKNFKLKARREETQVIGGAVRDLLARSSLFEERVIGREKDKKAVLKLLLEPKTDRKDVSVIPIVRMRGSGKTMLTRLIFNNGDVEKHFDLKLWVVVSDIAFDVKKIVERITISALGCSPGNLGIDYLTTKLREHVNGRRYLLVLDDFCIENHLMWLELEELLESGGKGSRIIVTTRSEKVAGIIGRGIRRYHLEAIDRNASWALFKKVAFLHGEEQLMDSNAAKFGMEIAEMCGGIPFAIRAIGSMLYYKNPETEWPSFCKNELSKLSQREDDFVLSLLKLCYNNLPSRLKACFAFCAHFYKDRDIDIEKLIRLWIAQGFVKLSDPGQCLEDVSYRYFLDLLSRSFFHNLTYTDDGKRTCKMQNLMHDLAILVARDEIEGSLNNESSDLHPNSSSQVSKSLSQSRMLRTILLEPSYFSQKHKERSLNRSLICKNIEIIPNFKFLRTLDLSNSGIKIVPSSISKLKHLRYLDLSLNDIKKLPSSFTKLQNLLTLDLSFSGIHILPNDFGKLKRLRFLDLSYSKVEMLPDSFGMLENLVTLNLNGCKNFSQWCSGFTNLVNLKHLNVDACHELSYIPCELSRLTNLQLLTYFPLRFPSGFQSCHRAQLSELKQLNMLRGSLKIIKLRLLRDAEYKAANLKEKKYLQSLWLSWALTDEDSDDEGNYCSEDINLGPRMLLEALETDFSASYEASLEALQPHPNLKKLYLLDYGGVSFPSWLPLLKNLQMLMLFHCPKFQCLPPLKQLHSLKTLILHQLTNLLYVSNGDENEHFHLSSSKTPPLSSLEFLKLSELPNLRGWWRPGGSNEGASTEIPSWLLPRTTFQRRGLLRSSNLQYLPPLKLFQSLKTLILQQLTNLVYVSYNGENESSDSSLLELAPLPALEHLQLSDLPNLRGWWRPSGSDLEVHIKRNNYKKFPTFRRLHRFHLEGVCSGLTSMPLFPHLSELTLKNTKVWNPFLLAGAVNEISPSTSSASIQESSFSFLSKLRCLSLVENKDLHFLPDWLKHLTSLESLFITRCSRLKYLSPCIEYLTSLQRLDIQICSEFRASCDDPDLWRPLRSLCILNLAQLSKLVDLPPGIQHATSLKQLKLSWCTALTCIPEWISNLKSLQVLSVSYCLKLASLPEGIREIKSLVKLEIESCHILLPRCRRSVGQDWPKISHIREIVLKPSPSKFDDFISTCSELLA